MLLPILVLLAAAPTLHTGEPFPELKAQALSGRATTLPQDAQGKVAFLVLGFSQAGGKTAEAWSKRFERDFKDDPRVTHYSLAMIGGMGKIAKPFIEGGMKKSMPPAQYDYMISFYSNTDSWKKRVGFNGPDDAYIVVLDSNGNVRYLHGGPLEDSAYVNAAAAVRALLK